MSAEQGNSRNKIKRLCIYALLTAVCLIIGYIESLVNLGFIAPGIKIGLANSVACLLIFSRDIKGALLVNIARILLSALLFGSPLSLVFALSGGIISLAAMIILSKCRQFSVIGVSAFGGVLHNMAQCVVGACVIGVGIFYYLPVLMISGVLSGALVGVLSGLILNRMKSENNVQ